ncbi:hypothetical protein C8J55DRAFT_3121 [Lentinula edodes]|uniref:Uncharacterized protein n=1 Tax=Lentinula lateritia TaxID=40482 RepID=A0A9W9E1D8_9AGAR|nr:hypothetical protein C8J55DRAFT_3121 [Lentinula edodes]
MDGWLRRTISYPLLIPIQHLFSSACFGSLASDNVLSYRIHSKNSSQLNIHPLRIHCMHGYFKLPQEYEHWICVLVKE